MVWNIDECKKKVTNCSLSFEERLSKIPKERIINKLARIVMWLDIFISRYEDMCSQSETETAKEYNRGVADGLKTAREDLEKFLK